MRWFERYENEVILIGLAGFFLVGRRSPNNISTAIRKEVDLHLGGYYPEIWLDV
jgi:hypothetical protein